MATRRSTELEQRLIEQEVRLSRAREAGELYTASRDAQREHQSSLEDRRWYRQQLVAMLRGARTEAELDGLGLSDEVIREVRLGGTLREAWARLHPSL